jgi:hypothetical protein
MHVRLAVASPILLSLVIAAGCGGADWSSGATGPKSAGARAATAPASPPSSPKTSTDVTSKGSGVEPTSTPKTTPTTAQKNAPTTARKSTPTTAPASSSVNATGISPAIASKGAPGSVPPGWIAYHDPSGVSLQHPKAWTIRPSQLGPLAVLIDGAGADSAGFRRSVNLLEQPLAVGLTTADYLRYSLAQVAQTGGVVETNRAVTLGGVTGREITWRVTQGGSSLRYLSVWAVRGQLAFLVTYSADAKNFARPLADVRRLIASIHLPPAA